jgi:hypothetical protein
MDITNITGRQWSLPKCPNNFSRDQREAFTSEGPLLESLNLLKNAIDGIKELPRGDQNKIFCMAKFIEEPILVFIDLDHFLLHGNLLRREIREAAMAFRNTITNLPTLPQKQAVPYNSRYELLIKHMKDDLLSDVVNFLQNSSTFFS